MRFEPEKKKRIIAYLLEKISHGSENVTKSVSEACDINQNTVHRYVQELLDQGVIRRVKRGLYEPVKKVYQYTLERDQGHLDSDTYAYDVYLKPLLAGFTPNVQEIWAYTFSEMVNNVMDHSAAEHLIVRVEQDCLNTYVSLTDDGVGIFRKIKEHFQLPSLDEAICELFKGKLTTDAENHSGEGIFFSSKMMDAFFIFSDGKVFTNNKYDNDKVMSVADMTPGTCVMMELSNTTHKEAQEVFDRYANVDGGFTKTRIPLKHIFASSPVSRSQAKRVCHRLERFEEVVLDFDGLDWMGQGFAHQIFSVFQKQHPNLRLIPENMTEAVSKMYHHVRQSEG